MAVKKIAEEEFDQTTKEGIWIADFYTDHCGPCKVLDLALDRLIHENPEVNLAKCNIEDSPAYAERFQIDGTPTLLFLNEGEITGRILGICSKEALEQELAVCIYGE